MDVEKKHKTGIVENDNWEQGTYLVQVWAQKKVCWKRNTQPPIDREISVFREKVRFWSEHKSKGSTEGRREFADDGLQIPAALQIFWENGMREQRLYNINEKDPEDGGSAKKTNVLRAS